MLLPRDSNAIRVSEWAVVLFGVLDSGMPVQFGYPMHARSAQRWTYDLTGLFCTSRCEREFTRRTAGYANQEV